MKTNKKTIRIFPSLKKYFIKARKGSSWKIFLKIYDIQKLLNKKNTRYNISKQNLI